MCGIVGFTGRRQAAPILLEGLAKLENHGYTFYSGTDTEAAVKLVDYYYKKYKLPLTQKNNIVRRKCFLLTMLFLFTPCCFAPFGLHFAPMERSADLRVSGFFGRLKAGASAPAF